MYIFLYKLLEKLINLLCFEVFKLLSIIISQTTGVSHQVVFIEKYTHGPVINLPDLRIERVF